MSSRDMDRRLLGGVAWLGGARLAVQLLSWGSTLLVVRLVTPVDYGVIGMATLFSTFLAIAAECGIGTAVLVSRDVDGVPASQLHGLALLAGASAAVLAALLAVPLGWFFHQPKLPAVVAVLSLTFLADGTRTVPVALLQRRMAYRAVAGVEAARSLTQMITVLTLAALGFGYWALAIGLVIGGTASAIVAGRLAWIAPSWPDRATLRNPLELAQSSLVARLGWQVYSTGDFLMVGRVLGSAALGQYTLAWNLASLPGEKLTNLVTGVTTSFFASLRDDRPAMRRYLLLLTEGLAMLTFPVLAAVAWIVGDAVTALWGSQWDQAVTPTRLLVLYAALNAVTVPVSQVLVATGQVAVTRTNSIRAVALLLPAFYLAATRGGIAAVAATWVVLFPLVIWIPASKARATLGIRWREQVVAVRPALVVTSAGLAAALLLREGVTDGFAPGLRMVTELAGWILAVLAAARSVYWQRVGQVVALVRSRRVSPAEE